MYNYKYIQHFCFLYRFQTIGNRFFTFFQINFLLHTFVLKFASIFGFGGKSGLHDLFSSFLS